MTRAPSAQERSVCCYTPLSCRLARTRACSCAQAEPEQKQLVQDLHLLKTDLFMQMIDGGSLPLRSGVKRLIGARAWLHSGCTCTCCSGRWPRQLKRPEQPELQPATCLLSSLLTVVTLTGLRAAQARRRLRGCRWLSAAPPTSAQCRKSWTF